MSNKVIVAALTVAASGAIVWAGAATSAAAASSVAASEPKEKDGSRRVCRNGAPTGTRFPQRVCRTQREWDEAAQRARALQERTDKEGRNGQTVNTPN